MRFVISALIMFIVTWRFSGTFAPRTSKMDEVSLKVYFEALPPDRHQRTRMEVLWRSSGYKERQGKELKRRALKLLNQNFEEWLKQPEKERHKLEEDLSRIFSNIELYRPDDEKRIFNELLRQNPEYGRDPLLIKSVIHKWYQSRKVQKREEAEANRTYQELSSQESHRLQTSRAAAAELEWTRLWSEQRKANLLYIYDQNKDFHGLIQKNIVIRWRQMYGNQYPLDGESLMNQARRLIRKNYVPKPEFMARAKERYDRLPPLNVLGYTRENISHILNSGKRVRIDTPSTSQSSEQHHQNVLDCIATPRLYAGHKIQQEHILDRGYHTVLPKSFHGVHNGASSSKRPIDLDLNLLDNKPNTSSDLNTPHHHYEYGASSNHSRTP